MRVVNNRKKQFKAEAKAKVHANAVTEYSGAKVYRPIDEKMFAQSIYADENVYHRVWVRPQFIVYEIYTKRPIEIIGFLIVWIPWNGETQWHRIEGRPYQSMWRDMEIIADQLEKENIKTIAK